MRKALLAGLLTLLLSIGGGSVAFAQADPTTTAPTGNGGGTAGGFDHWGLLGLLGLAGFAGSARNRAGARRERRRQRKGAKQGTPETAFVKLRADEARRVAADAEQRKARTPVWKADARPQGPAYPAWSTASNPTPDHPMAPAPEPEARPAVRSPASSS